MKDCLQQAREVINEVDAQMAELFEKRMTAVQQVLAYKKEPADLGCGTGTDRD